MKVFLSICVCSETFIYGRTEEYTHGKKEDNIIYCNILNFRCQLYVQ